MQSKSHSFGVHLLGSVKKSKQLEQLVLIFNLDSDSWVLHWNLDHAMSPWVQKVLMVLSVDQVCQWIHVGADYFDKTSILGEFKSVWHQVEHYLLESLHVWAHHIVYHIIVNSWNWDNLINSRFQREVNHFWAKMDPTKVSFEPLNAHYLMYRFSHIKIKVVLAEFPWPHLGKV
mgnify:CR=1 FL=1